MIIKCKKDLINAVVCRCVDQVFRLNSVFSHKPINILYPLGNVGNDVS